MGKLDGKVVMLTGVGSGLGKQYAIRMAEEGAKLAICDIAGEKLEETRRICEEAGAEVLAYVCDVGNYNKLVEFVDLTIKKFGTVDCLVNNAYKGHAGPFITLSFDDFISDLKVVVGATWHLMQLLFPYMKDKENGASIINVGSRWGLESPIMSSSYGAIKEAVRAITRTAAREWGQYNIRCNAIAPGGLTDNNKATIEGNSEIGKQIMKELCDNVFNRAGDPHDDVAPVVVFLASDDSRWISGQTISCDGGGWINC